MSICYCNGKYMPTEECSLPVSDLAIQRGVGAFESIRVYDGHPFAMTQHLERLATSTAESCIEAADIIKSLPDIIREGIRQKDCPQDGIVKPYITGGDVNNKGHFPAPRLFVLFEDAHRPTDEERKKGVALEPNRVERAYPIIKGTNYLQGFIPLTKTNKESFEALYITREGEITESTSSTFFLCLNGRLVTAPVGRVLRGITREILISLAKNAGYKIEERCPLESELKDAQEAFLSGSVKEILSIVRIGEQIIGNGKPGPVAQHLQHLFTANKSRWME